MKKDSQAILLLQCDGFLNERRYATRYTVMCSNRIRGKDTFKKKTE